MGNLKEYFSLQKSSNETSESDEKCQKNNQKEEDQGICFLCNEEEYQGNAEVFSFSVVNVTSGQIFIVSYIL